MSKFFGEGNNSSDSEDNRSDNGSEDANVKKTNPNYDYDLDSFKTDDKKRVVQSENQRFKTSLKKSIHTVNTTMKNLDFAKSWDSLQQILKIIQKHKKYIEKEGYPNFYILFLMKINEQINGISNQDKKKLKGTIATAFNTMKRQFKNKIIPNYQNQIKRVEQQGIKQQEEMMNEDNNSQESSQSEEDDRQLLKSEDPMVRRRYWLKKEIRNISEKDQRKQAQKGKKDQKQQKDDLDEYKQKKKKKINIIEKKEKKAKVGVTSKEAEDQMSSMIKNFYKLKKQDQREDYLQTLNNIIKSSSKYQDNQKLSFLLADIPIRIQVSRQMRFTHFERSRWLEIFNHTERCFTIMRQSQQQDLMDNILQFSQTNQATKVATSEVSIYNSIKYFVMILEAQLRKAFIYIDNNEVQFSERLQDLIKFIDFMYKFCQDMSFKQELEKSASELAFKVIQNMYFMSSSFMNKIKKQFRQDFGFIELEDGNKLQRFAQPILKYQPQQQVTKTILYLVYNHAVNYRPKAKDLLVMSNVPNIIGKCDYYTQALYNRAIVTIGISAFRHGNLFEVQQYLSEICGYAKQKQQCKEMLRQFLAQGSRNNPDIPRSKILPYYLHLNCEMIECLQLIATMILQIPYLLNENGRITSKTFKKLISEYEKSHFIAQPIHNKDLIYAASNDLKTAQWQKCFNRLMQLNIWKQMNCLDEIKIKLLANIKQQALKCYLVGNRKTFTSISLDNLTTKFALSSQTVKKLVCKWIYNNELKAFITDDGYLRMIQKKQSEMQKVCEDLYTKLEEVMKIHEGIFDNQLSTLADDQDPDKQMRLQRRFSIPLTEKIKAVLSKRG